MQNTIIHFNKKIRGVKSGKFVSFWAGGVTVLIDGVNTDILFSECATTEIV